MSSQDLSHFECKLSTCLPKEVFNYGYIYEELAANARLWFCQTLTDNACTSKRTAKRGFFVCIRFLYFSCSENTCVARSSKGRSIQ